MKNRVFLVATNADYTVYVNARDGEEAVKKANKFYKEKYGEKRNDFEPYDLEQRTRKYGGVLEW